MRIPLTHFQFGPSCFFSPPQDDRRSFRFRRRFRRWMRELRPNASVNAAAMAPSPPPSHPAVMADAVEPQYGAVYGQIKDGEFTVAAVQLAQVNSAFLRTNVAYATKESPGTIVVDPPITISTMWKMVAGNPLRCRGRARRFRLVWRRDDQEQAGMAGLVSAQGNGGPPAGPQEINGCAAKRGGHARRPRQSARRPRHVSLAREPRYIFSHPWHQ